MKRLEHLGRPRYPTPATKKTSSRTTRTRISGLPTGTTRTTPTPSALKFRTNIRLEVLSFALKTFIAQLTQGLSTVPPLINGSQPLFSNSTAGRRRTLPSSGTNKGKVNFWRRRLKKSQSSPISIKSFGGDPWMETTGLSAVGSSLPRWPNALTVTSGSGLTGERGLTSSNTSNPLLYLKKRSVATVEELSASKLITVSESATSATLRRSCPTRSQLRRTEGFEAAGNAAIRFRATI